MKLSDRWSHCLHTPHKHPPLFQNALLHRSQTANPLSEKCEITNSMMKLHLFIHCLKITHFKYVFLCDIITWHFPPRQAEIDPCGTVLSDSHRVPSMNWDPRLTIKSCSRERHISLHWESPGGKGEIEMRSDKKEKKLTFQLIWSTWAVAYGRNPGIDWLWVCRYWQRLLVCGWTLLSHELKLSRITRL